MASTKVTKSTKKKTTGRKVATKKKSTPKKNNFQKWLAYMKKYPPTGGSPIPSGSTMIMTARKQGSGYVPDRTYDELVSAFNQDIYPLLRVIGGNVITYYPLKSFVDGVFIFDESTTTISPDNIQTVIVNTYTYGPSGFKGKTDSSSTQNVDIGYIHI